MQTMPLNDLLKYIKSRGLPMPDLNKWIIPELSNYKMGTYSGFGMAGPRVPYISADNLQRLLTGGGGGQQNGRPPGPMHRSAMAMPPGMSAPQQRPQQPQQGFQTAWGTTQGQPAMNAGGGQSMFGVPQGMPAMPPQYQRPPGPTTTGYNPTMPPPPSQMGGGGMPQRPMPPWLRSM